MKTVLSTLIALAWFGNVVGQVAVSADSAFIELETGKKKEAYIKVTSNSNSKIKMKWQIIQDDLKGTSGWDVEFCDCMECRVVYPTSGNCDTTGLDSTDFGYIFAAYVTEKSGNFSSKKMKVKISNINDTADYKVITFITRKATGSKELVKQDSKNALFPNPSNGLTHLKLTSSASDEAWIELVDLSGSVVKSEAVNVQSGTNEIELDYSNVEKGVYFVRIQTGNATETQKLTLR